LRLLHAVLIGLNRQRGNLLYLEQRGYGRSLWSLILIVMACSLQSHARASEPDAVVVFVNGIGQTYAAAETDAMRLAIQKVFGTLVISERTVSNDQLSERDFSYTRGAVRDFTPLNVGKDSKTGLVTVDARVTVSSSEVGKRLIYSSDTQKMDGRRLANEIERAQRFAALEKESFENAANIVNHLSEEISHAAFDVAAGKLEVIRQGPVVETIIPVALYLNQKVVTNYCLALKSLIETDTVKYAKKKGQWPKDYAIVVKLRNSSCGGSFEVPEQFFDSIANAVVSTGICISLKNGEGAVMDSAFFPSKQGGWSIDHDRDGIYRLGRNLFFDGSFARGQSFELQLPERFLKIFSNSQAINARMSREAECKKR
jgi:hypothetical protein